VAPHEERRDELRQGRACYNPAVSDPQRARQRPAEELGGAERDARIEHLLLTGLDHYFAADYEQAINLWTRVLFLDRAHDRARAYIERARSAQAERQRESEELLHAGLEAFGLGDVRRARYLVNTAIDRGASDETALGLLTRLDRLAPRVTGAARRPSPLLESWPDEQLGAGGGLQERQGRPARGWWPFVVALVVLLSAVTGWMVARQPPSASIARLSAPAPAAPLVVPVPPLDVPPASETYLLRARLFFQAGRPRDALRELDRIGIGDPQRTQSERLRGDLQRALLNLARLPVEPPAAGTPHGE
jgi:tetratricopeptide (TPR) repeat protein